MILSAGLSPAWQQILVFDSFARGEVNRARQAHWCASGKAINVGLAVHHLGGTCHVISTVGGAAAAAFDQEFRSLGLSATWIETESATRVCTTIVESHDGETTELVENAKPNTQAELDAFSQAFLQQADDAELVVLAGSLSAGTPSTLYADLLRTTKCPAILDARGPELLTALEFRPLLVKPNRKELAATVGRSLETEPELLAAMHELIDRGAQWVAITHGKQAVLAASRDGSWRLVPPRVSPVVNAIGSGDCMAAGIAHAVIEGREILDAIRFGIGAAAENVTQLLPARIDRQRAAAWAERVAIEQLR